ncbi:hypothetical protein CHS0354_017877 [Potamilus streckersoni]|uniref:FAST kinase leucine-rich domain-containing protein n=1 Tax=Potamilus streckersoni TaxID=2493646 RepID=A0AAE0T2M8_9BIVA|nr:hypothetical protein CHS0354_017877 [Potamilus streckersoni]
MAAFHSGHVLSRASMHLRNRFRVFTPLLSQITCKSIDKSVDMKSILTQSTTIIQDQNDIQEMPVIVRMMDHSVFPFIKNTGKMEPKIFTEDDKTFKADLQKCISIEEVFKKLEVPSDKVTGYSAAVALLQICKLKHCKAESKDLDSFISKAVMNELYHTVSKEISRLSNDIIISLAGCYLNSDTFQTNCVLKINKEIEKRIGDSAFEILELSQLSVAFASFNHAVAIQMVANVWVDIGNRSSEIDHTNIAQLYKVLPSGKQFNYLINLLEKQFAQSFWKLQGNEIVGILAHMIRLQSSGRNLTFIRKWINIHIHNVSQDEFIQIVSAFIHFKYYDEYFIRALERFVQAKADMLDRDLLSLIMEYFCSHKHLSTLVMDKAMKHFVKHGHSYSPLQLYAILKPFGYLNYLPKDSYEFLKKVEQVIREKFYEIDCPDLVEILTSFVFVGRIPVNFARFIFCQSFFGKIKDISNESQRKKTEQFLELLQMGYRYESNVSFPLDYHFPEIRHSQKVFDVPPYSHAVVRKSLNDLVGIGMYRETSLIHNWPSNRNLDFMVWVNNSGEFVYPEKYTNDDNITRLIILVVSPDYCCVNTGHLLGEPATYVRWVKKLNYKVIIIQLDSQYRFINISPERNIYEYLKRELGKYTNF